MPDEYISEGGCLSIPISAGMAGYPSSIHPLITTDESDFDWGQGVLSPDTGSPTTEIKRMEW
jgi:hypothetical protein